MNTYDILEGKKTIKYEKDYIIFGNSEIRIEIGDKTKKLVSNFGIERSFFNTNKKKVNEFLGQAER